MTSKYQAIHAAHSFFEAAGRCKCGWEYAEKRTYACGEDRLIELAHAAHVEAMVTEAGIAIVELPEADEDGGFQTQALGYIGPMPHASGDGLFVAAWRDTSDPRSEWTTGQARTDAAALLAAAVEADR